MSTAVHDPGHGVEGVLVKVDAHVGVITINRPAARNAIDLAVSRGVATAIDELESRSDVAVIVITGAEGVFSAGMDLKAFARGERPSIPGRGLCGLTDHSISKPIIAAVEGYALAGGFEVALATDLIVASRSAMFGVPEVTRGLVAAGGALTRMAKTMPYGAAMVLVLTGDRFGAERAHELGLVTHLSTEGHALEDALAVATRIAANAPLAVELTKRIVSTAVGWSDEQQYAWQRGVAEAAFISEDAKEGAQAFAERREPVWRGR